MTVTPESNIVAAQVRPHERRDVFFGDPPTVVTQDTQGM